MDRLTPEQALEAFQALLKQEGIEEIEVTKVCIDTNKSYKSKLIFVVELNGNKRPEK